MAPADAVGYGYDLKGQLTHLVYPNGSAVNRQFDAAGRIAGLTDWLGNTNSFAYDADSNLVSATFPGNQVDHQSYDPTDQLATSSDTVGSTFNASFIYLRNADSLITTAFSTLLASRWRRWFSRRIGRSDLWVHQLESGLLDWNCLELPAPPSADQPVRLRCRR